MIHIISPSLITGNGFQFLGTGKKIIAPAPVIIMFINNDSTADFHKITDQSYLLS